MAWLSHQSRPSPCDTVRLPRTQMMMFLPTIRRSNTGRTRSIRRTRSRVRRSRNRLKTGHAARFEQRLQRLQERAPDDRRAPSGRPGTGRQPRSRSARRVQRTVRRTRRRRPGRSRRHGRSGSASRAIASTAGSLSTPTSGTGPNRSQSAARSCPRRARAAARAWAGRSAPSRASSQSDRRRGPTEPSRPPAGPGRPSSSPTRTSARASAPRPASGSGTPTSPASTADPLHHVAVVRDAVLARAPARRGSRARRGSARPTSHRPARSPSGTSTMRSMIALKLSSEPKPSMRSAPWKCGVLPRALLPRSSPAKPAPESTPARMSIITRQAVALVAAGVDASPPSGRIAPSFQYSSGSVVALPAESTIQPSGTCCSFIRASSSLPPATTLVAMSRMNGRR